MTANCSRVCKAAFSRSASASAAVAFACASAASARSAAASAAAALASAAPLGGGRTSAATSPRAGPSFKCTSHCCTCACSFSSPQAPAANSTSTQGALPRAAASCSAERPEASLCSAGAPQRSSSSNSSTFPSLAAQANARVHVGANCFAMSEYSGTSASTSASGGGSGGSGDSAAVPSGVGVSVCGSGDSTPWCTAAAAAVPSSPKSSPKPSSSAAGASGGGAASGVSSARRSSRSAKSYLLFSTARSTTLPLSLPNSSRLNLAFNTMPRRARAKTSFTPRRLMPTSNLWLNTGSTRAPASCTSWTIAKLRPCTATSWLGHS
mmetsp:Transcript_74577/g.242167  ORF Transcript_74577/g.242167 Transcript_74577/m.242167 type:complete len:323 (+) Transcript_74577:473-1441(+)